MNAAAASRGGARVSIFQHCASDVGSALGSDDEAIGRCVGSGVRSGVSAALGLEDGDADVGARFVGTLEGSGVGACKGAAVGGASTSISAVTPTNVVERSASTATNVPLEMLASSKLETLSKLSLDDTSNASSTLAPASVRRRADTTLVTCTADALTPTTDATVSSNATSSAAPKSDVEIPLSNALASNELT